jgi:hypothetical protein
MDLMGVFVPRPTVVPVHHNGMTVYYFFFFSYWVGPLKLELFTHVEMDSS